MAKYSKKTYLSKLEALQCHFFQNELGENEQNVEKMLDSYNLQNSSIRTQEKEKTGS